LNRPLANESRVRSVLVRLGKIAGTISGIVRVRSADKEVDVGIDYDVWVNVGPVRVPGLRANEIPRDGGRQGLRPLANFSESQSIIDALQENS
jgi:hypothetical protein